MTALAFLVIFLFFRDSVDSLVFSVCLLLLLNNGHFIVICIPLQKKKKYSNNFISKYNLCNSWFDIIDELIWFFFKINRGTFYATMSTHDNLKICYLPHLQISSFTLSCPVLRSHNYLVIFKSLYDLGDYQSFL